MPYGVMSSQRRQVHKAVRSASLFAPLATSRQVGVTGNSEKQVRRAASDTRLAARFRVTARGASRLV